jgi:uncharacterized membrane-anchored protein
MTVRRKGLCFALAVALQLLILLGMVGRHSYTLATGTEVTLKSEPIDPWNPWKGEYVRLRYNISTFQLPNPTGEEPPFRSGERVWVTLRAGASVWQVVGISKDRPTTQSGEVAVQARVDWVQWWDGKERIPSDFPHGQVHLTYGVEEFYVPEGEGPGLEQQRDGITVKAKVDRFGRMALAQVLVDGKPVEWK